MSKLSNIALRKIAADKNENPYNDVMDISSGLGELASGAIGGGAAGIAPGHLIGLLQSSNSLPTATQLKDYNAQSLLPGMAALRSIARDRRVDEALSGGKTSRSAIISEHLGALLLPLLVGAGVGVGSYYGTDSLSKKTGKIDKALGINNDLDRQAIGLGVGTTAAALTAAVPYLVGLLRKRRDAATHAEYLAESPELKNMLIPGVAAHNLARRDKMRLLAGISSK